MESSPPFHQGGRAKKVPPGQPRARPINSCLACRDRKKGCDKKQPICGNCDQNPDSKKPCVYAHGKSEVLKVHKQKMQSLKEDFASSVANESIDRGSKFEGNHTQIPLILTESALSGGVEEGRTDLGIRLGKLRISDRIGGISCLRMVEELTFALNFSAQQYPDDAIELQWCSPSPGFSEPDPLLRASEKYCAQDDPKPQVSCPYFPNRSIADVLLSQYWERVHPVARVLHRPFFEERWNIFWEIHRLGRQPEKSLLALVFTVLFSGLVSMTDDIVQSVMKSNKRVLMEKMRVATDLKLAQSNCFYSTKVEMLQALVIYLISVSPNEVSLAHPNIVAAAIRAAECMGLHEDPVSHYYSPVQAHIRRLLWYQLLVLDIRTCETTAPRPQIRKGDFSARIPLNLDDNEILLCSENSKKWTSMTVTIIRFRCNEFTRSIWNDRLHLKEGKSTINEILINIKAFDTHMQETYCKIADMNIPIQRYGCLVAKILTLRTYALVLHQYGLDQKVEMSERLRETFIKYGVETMDAVQELETGEAFATWQWLAGLLQQHHYALVMLLELLKYPYMTQAGAILRGLDYVFEPPKHYGLTTLTRVRYTVIELRNRLTSYVAQRRLCNYNNLHEIRDLSDSEKSESSTCCSSNRTSATPQLSSPTSHTYEFADHHVLRTASMNLNSCVSLQMDNSTSNLGPMISFFPQQDFLASQGQAIDIEAPLIRQHFPESEFVMGIEDRHIACETAAYSPDVLHRCQLPMQWAPTDGHLDYSQHLDGISNTPTGELQDEAVEEFEDNFGSGYEVEPLSGHSITRATSTIPVISYRPDAQISYDSAEPAASLYFPEPNPQNYDDVYTLNQQQQQQEHAFISVPPTSFSQFDTHPGSSTYRNGYSSHGAVPGSYGNCDRRISTYNSSCQRQQPEHKHNSTLAYDIMTQMHH